MTNRSLAAAVDRSPFFTHEPMPVSDNPDLNNFWEFQRQFARAIFESLTLEETMILFKFARALAPVLTSMSLEDYLAFGKVFRAIAKTFTQVEPEKVVDATKAFNTGWALMAKYRKTGVVD